MPSGLLPLKWTRNRATKSRRRPKANPMLRDEIAGDEHDGDSDYEFDEACHDLSTNPEGYGAVEYEYQLL